MTWDGEIVDAEDESIHAIMYMFISIIIYS